MSRTAFLAWSSDDLLVLTGAYIVAGVLAGHALGLLSLQQPVVRDMAAVGHGIRVLLQFILG